MAKDPTRPMYVGAAWKVVLRDIGVDERAVLRRTGQPRSLFDGDGSYISLDDYFALLDAAEAEGGGPAIALQAGTTLSNELFDPAYFAASCSPDLNTALCRLADYMRLVGPFALDVNVDEVQTTVVFRGKTRLDLPRTLGLSQLAFLVALARRATRHHVVPRTVELVGVTDNLDECETFFGRPVLAGADFALSFEQLDSVRPFLTRNDEMWEALLPGLRRNMSEAGLERPVGDAVVESLFTMLPSGRSNVADVAADLGLSPRTLQRRLTAEGTTWSELLNGTRERLARHYFETTDLSPAEVGFLLGFEDPNSLFRAFHRWTGTTPDAWRTAARRS